MYLNQQNIFSLSNIRGVNKRRKDPFNINREFKKKYLGLKCPHAQFTLVKSKIILGSLNELPLTNEYLNTLITINGKIEKFQEVLERR
ncbi:hypothetical protein EDI_195190 [Entamoeba dispar SAW760]|uniref:Uncharacterized protein n=1 Tax=Entamoeba dispar (strain ATCC PRA-260 / SAW760) TaxID=370354 RepID=B0EIZ8_ENTDS|nr:uncharacterized protein EDI_195190 [Entamoeba dispar SAW760]EDR25500.1 hypothetical protein EDI_195190 [Entamoeba dispar SAW760]|eukprot:EDR25500.1 hypothetical protein EDI_195190 [Entamoeba dispar SAW760]